MIIRGLTILDQIAIMRTCVLCDLNFRQRDKRGLLLIKTIILQAKISRILADSLNRESGRVYSRVMTTHCCPNCRHRYKPKGRKYECPACGFCGHRDVVGALNILSRYRFGEVSKIALSEKEKYRHPYLCGGKGKRSRPDTADMADAQVSEAAQL